MGIWGTWSRPETGIQEGQRDSLLRSQESDMIENFFVKEKKTKHHTETM